LGAGQLEEEIARNAWLTVQADPTGLFLRRPGGTAFGVHICLSMLFVQLRIADPLRRQPQRQRLDEHRQPPPLETQ
jgi:hypothetical protein